MGIICLPVEPASPIALCMYNFVFKSFLLHCSVLAGLGSGQSTRRIHASGWFVRMESIKQIHTNTPNTSIMFKNVLKTIKAKIPKIFI